MIAKEFIFFEAEKVEFSPPYSVLSRRQLGVATLQGYCE